MEEDKRHSDGFHIESMLLQLISMKREGKGSCGLWASGSWGKEIICHSFLWLMGYWGARGQGNFFGKVMENSEVRSGRCI